MVERIEVNLLPAEYRVRPRNLRISREIFYPIVIVLVLWAWLAMWTVVLDGQIRSLAGEVSDLNEKIQKNRHIEQEINELKADKHTIVQKIQALELINVNRARWVRLMEVISENLPEYTWITSIQEKDSTQPVLVIEGQTFSFPEVANYMSRLKTSPYIIMVDLTTIEQNAGNDRSYKFGISCLTNPNVGITEQSDSSLVASANRVQ